MARVTRVIDHENDGGSGDPAPLEEILLKLVHPLETFVNILSVPMEKNDSQKNSRLDLIVGLISQ